MIGDEMALSDTTIARIHEDMNRFPNPRGALLGALHMARRETSLDPDVFAQLAREFRMTPIEVAEVASFYSLFNLPRARAVFQVCTNLSCCARGAKQIVAELERQLGIKAGSATPDGRFAIAQVECIGSCATAPVMQVNSEPYLENLTSEYVASLTKSPEEAIAARRPAPIISTIPEGVDGYLLPPDGEKWLSLKEYRNRGGYRAIDKALTMEPSDLAKLVEESGLRGRGGGGFVTGKKWSFMPPRDGRPRYLAVNADESEPGTFKDRQIMERNPHLLIEGIMIAARAIQADAAYIYIRGEYVDAYRTLHDAVSESYRAGLLGEHSRLLKRRFDVQLQPGAGAYICGEESGMLESMEGKKGQPRKRPPFPAQAGLWQDPTTVDNVETLSHLPAILRHGAQWFRDQGAPKSAGHTLFGISGHVKRPGVFELPLGVTLRDLIYKYAGGLEDGRSIKAVVPGGVSMPVLRGDQIDVAMDHESVKDLGTMLGTAGVVVMDERTCMVRAAIAVARFFRHESCGQCTQCREGTGWIFKTLSRIEAGEGAPEDLQVIADACDFIDGKCICALADAAAWSARAFLKQFRDDFEDHISGHRCPFTEGFQV